MAKCNKCDITIHDEGFSCADNCDKVSKKMTTKISLEKFAEKLSDHTRKDLIEMLYDKMSDDDLIEMAAEEDQPDCEVCHEKTLSDCRHENVGCCDGCHIRVMCQDCGMFDEEEKVWRCPDCQEKHNDEPPACQTCKKPCWSNNDGWQMIHGCVVCQDCFDEHEKEHALEKKTRFIPRFNFSYADGDERGCDIYGQWWVRYKPDDGIWSWDYKKEEWCEEHEQVMYKNGMKCGGCMDELEKKINLTVGA